MTFRMEVESNPARTIYGIRYDPKVVRAESRLAGGTIYEPEPNNGRGTISALVREARAQAGFNGDFFQWTPDPGGDPLGLMLQRGVVVSAPGKGDRAPAVLWAPDTVPTINRSTLKISVKTSAGTFQPTMLNGKVEQNGLGLSFDGAGDIYGHNPLTVVHLTLSGTRPTLSGTYHATVRKIETDVKRAAIPGGAAVLAGDGEWATRLKQLTPGAKLTIDFRLEGVPEGTTEAIGGGPVLLAKGVYAGPKEGPQAPRHPRTAMGVTAEGMVWSVVIDGRQSLSVGATITETAEVMRRWGCVEALNLDGGGSSTLHALGITLNRPSGGVERTVANGVVLYTALPAVEKGAEALAIQGPEILAVGASLALTATVGGKPIPQERIVWSAQGSAWVDQSGKLTGISEGTAEVAILVDGRIARLKVVVAAKQSLAVPLRKTGVLRTSTHTPGAFVGGECIVSPSCGC